MVIQLIAKDKQEEFQFQGRCKLLIDSVSKLLLVEPFNEDFKMISAMFKWEFFTKKNILFVFAEYKFQDFALIFENSNKCNKAYNILIKKGVTVGNKELISQRFLPSIFNEISKNNESSLKMKEILLKWIEFFNEKEKEELIQNLKDYNVYDLFYSNNVGDLQKNHRKRRAKDVIYRKESKIRSTSNSYNKNSIKGCSDKQTEFILSKSSQHVFEPRKVNPEKYGKKEIVEADNFKLFNDLQNEIDQSEMVIFATSDQSKCFEYSWNRSRKNFICYRCQKKTKYVTAELCQKNDGIKYLKLNKSKHVCEPREYDPDKFESTKSKLFFKIFKYKHNGADISKLIVFCETNKNLCYEFYWNKSHQKYYCSYCPMENRPSATVCQNEDSKDYLFLSEAEHVCDLREFDPNKYKDDNIIDKSMYNLTSTTIGKVKNQILIVFTSQEKKFYHKFFYNRQMKYFYCSKCYFSSKIRITATLENEGKENEVVNVSNQKHMCDAFESTTNFNIVEAPNYQLIKRKVHGKIHRHLIVFTNHEKTECFEYSWKEKEKFFICYTCSHIHKTFVYAKIFKNNANKECVELCEKPHKCKPIEFEPENISFKIVKQPDFKLYEEIYCQKRCKRLAIIDPKNRNMGYIYCYLEKEKKYICGRCRCKKTFVTAKVLQNENGENYLELNKNEHVCELQKL